MPDLPRTRRRTVLKGTAAATLASLVGMAGAQSDDEGYEAEDGNGDDGGVETPGPPDSPVLAAHRGFAGVHPENTVGAVEKAVQGGHSNDAENRAADMIECDVVPAGGKPWDGEDFELVVFHDDRLDDLTDLEGYVWETDVESVLDAEVLESGETIPTLDEVVEATPPEIPLNIEWKAAGVSEDDDATEDDVETWDPFTERALDILSEHENEFVVQSFSSAALESVRNADADVPIAFLFWDSIEDGLEVVRDLDCEYIQPPYTMIADSPFFREEYVANPEEWNEDIDLVEEAHSEGRQVVPWTIDTWYQAEQLVEAGVDGIIADYPNVFDWGASQGGNGSDSQSGNGSDNQGGNGSDNQSKNESDN